MESDLHDSYRAGGFTGSVGRGSRAALLMIAFVSVIGTWRQKGYGNVNLRDAFVIGILSPVGVLIGVVVANEVPERALRIGFALLAFYMAWRLLKRVFKKDPPATPADPATELP